MGSVVKTLPNGQVALRVNTEGMALAGGGARVVFAQSDELRGAELPELPETEQLIEIDGEAFRSAMDGVIPLCRHRQPSHLRIGAIRRLRWCSAGGGLRHLPAVRDLPHIPR